MLTFINERLLMKPEDTPSSSRRLETLAIGNSSVDRSKKVSTIKKSKDAR